MAGASTAFTLASRSLRRAKVRSLLMGLGLIIGIVSIMLTVATGEGTRRSVEQAVKSMVGDLDVLFVQPGGAAQRGMATMQSATTTLTMDDAQAIARNVPNVRMVGMQQSAQGSSIEANGKSGTTFLFGVTGNWQAIRGDSVAAGAFFTDADGASLSRVVVIGADVAKEFFPAMDPVGQRLRIRGLDFVVTGVLAPNGAGPGGASMDALAYIPLETARRRVFNRDALSLVSVKLVDASKWPETQEAVTALVRQRHGLQGAALNDFRVSSPQAMMARMANIDTTLRRSLLWVGGFAILIGAVVVANLMFAATTARRREIAMRRAVGARRADILAQFWVESTLVSLVAAATGIVIGTGIIAAGTRMTRIPLAVSWPITLGTAAITIALGAVAGYFPARRAATLSPSEALRESA
jgi:putative ABC transport system permease protein